MLHRPTVIVNVAMTVDGKLDTVARRGAAISSPADFARVDRLRAECDAIMVGGGTLRENDPRLTVKSPALREARRQRRQASNPTKVGVISEIDLNPSSRFINHGPAHIILFTSQRTIPSQVAQWQARGVEVAVLGESRVDLVAALHHLHEHGYGRVLVEGGGTLIAALLAQKLVDELYVYVAPKLFAGATAPTLADGPGWQEHEAVSLCLLAAEVLEEGGVLLHYGIGEDQRAEQLRQSATL